MSDIGNIQPSSFLDKFINKEILKWDNARPEIPPSCSRSRYDVWHLVDWLSERGTFKLTKQLGKDTKWWCEIDYRGGRYRVSIFGERPTIAITRAALLVHELEGNKIPTELYS